MAVEYMTVSSLRSPILQIVKNGIPDDAFKPIEGDDKEYCKELKKQNKSERKDIERGQKSLFQRICPCGCHTAR